MMLIWFILVPLIGGVLAWVLGKRDARRARWIALGALAVVLLRVVILWMQAPSLATPGKGGAWLAEVNLPWIPQLGISFHLAVDGLSLLLLALTALLGILSVAASWTEIREQVGPFYLQLLWVLAGINGVFLSLDLLLFYFFWEMMLVPMYFLIAQWGHEHRAYAATKFFLFTQFSGLLMLLAILGLYFAHGSATHTYTFDYQQLLGTATSGPLAMLLMLGFFVAFAVKLPVVPVHTWLPDAHTEAPTAGSVVLAGLLLKTGAYGLLRFVVPLFPQAALAFAPVAMILGVIGILYGAILSFAQTDLKRLVAYTSVSHMGFVLLGVFSWNETALQGAIMQVLCHGISTGALFILVGAIQERTGTRDISRLGGLWSTVPALSATGLVFALASLGLPGLGNFVGEFLVLLGAFQVNITLAVLATLGLVAATVYALWMVQRVFHGENIQGWKLPDLSGRELAVMAVMIAAIVWLGIYPQPVLDVARPALQALQQNTGSKRIIIPAAGAFHGPESLTETTAARRGMGEVIHDIR